jgi:hypothetical protein
MIRKFIIIYNNNKESDDFILIVKNKIKEGAVMNKD